MSSFVASPSGRLFEIIDKPEMSKTSSNSVSLIFGLALLMFSSIVAAKNVGLKTFYVERKNEFSYYKKPKNLDKFMRKTIWNDEEKTSMS